MTARGYGSKSDLETEIEVLDERISALVMALDEIHVLAEQAPPALRYAIHEWTAER